jgi:hypothetical protein
VKLRYATWYTDELRRSLGFDARFPNQNQTKHCWQNYVDYHKCIIAKGEDFAPCRQVRWRLLDIGMWGHALITAVPVGLPIPLPQRLDLKMGRPAWYVSPNSQRIRPARNS